MKNIRVLLANCPPVIGEFEVRELIDAQEDMEVVGEVMGQVNVLVAMRKITADAVILGMTDSKVPGLSSHLLAEHPNLTILCLTSKGEFACIVIDSSQPTNILSTLRQAVWDRCMSHEEEKDQRLRQ